VLHNFFKRRDVQISSADNERSELNWVTLTMGGACLTVFGFLLSYYWAAARFVEDVEPFLIMLSIIGFWQGYRSLSTKPVPKSLYTSFGVVLAILSILLSTLVALSVNEARFEIIRLLTPSK
jgi:hypothetical protein